MKVNTVQIAGILAMVMLASSVEIPMAQENYSSGGTFAPKEYFPLLVGNQWVYDYHRENSNQNTIDSVVTTSIVDSISEYHLFDRYFLYSGLAQGDSSLFRVNDSGKVMRYINGRDILWYDFSAREGDTWIVSVRHQIFTGDTVDVVGTLKSKADTFIIGQDTLSNCYRFQFSFTKMFPEMTLWQEVFAPSIGLVKREEGSMYWVCQSYRFKEGSINGRHITLVSSLQDNSQGTPKNFFLKQNYPNPFNSETRIGYIVKSKTCANVSLEIYNLRGQRVRTLVRELQPSGSYEVIWEGKDDFGNNMPSGVYLYSVVVGESRITKKMVLVK